MDKIMLFIEMIIGDLMFELVAKAGDQNCCMEPKLRFWYLNHFDRNTMTSVNILIMITKYH